MNELNVPHLKLIKILLAQTDIFHIHLGTP